MTWKTTDIVRNRLRGDYNCANFQGQKSRFKLSQSALKSQCRADLKEKIKSISNRSWIKTLWNPEPKRSTTCKQQCVKQLKSFGLHKFKSVESFYLHKISLSYGESFWADVKTHWMEMELSRPLQKKVNGWSRVWRGWREALLLMALETRNETRLLLRNHQLNCFSSQS